MKWALILFIFSVSTFNMSSRYYTQLNVGLYQHYNQHLLLLLFLQHILLSQQSCCWSVGVQPAGAITIKEMFRIKPLNTVRNFLKGIQSEAFSSTSRSRVSVQTKSRAAESCSVRHPDPDQLHLPAALSGPRARLTQ